MIRLDYFPRSHGRQMRRELTAMGEHLLAAAEQGARQAGKRSRRTGKVARARMGSAAMALRGEREPRWPWLATGLVAGVAIGAASAVAASRWRNTEGTPAEQAESVANALREKAGSAAESVRGRANAAATKVRELVTHPDSTEPNPVPPATEPIR